MHSCSRSVNASIKWDRKYGVCDETVESSSLSLPAGETTPPSFVTRVCTGLVAGTKFIASGLETVAAEVAEERLSICKGCEHLGKYKVCDLCGCFVLAKVKLPLEECPEGLWGVVLDRQSQNESGSED